MLDPYLTRDAISRNASRASVFRNSRRGNIVESLTRLAPADSDAIRRLLAAPGKPSGARSSSPHNDSSQEIQRRIGQLRSALTKAVRAKLARDLAEHDSTRLALAVSLSNLSTEGDLGEAPLQAVADTMLKQAAGLE